MIYIVLLYIVLFFIMIFVVRHTSHKSKDEKIIVKP